ncbi:Protein of unknown function [Andreprevotia lacus DSM 23236]|jgi:hypothetical protein|uniref:DUF3617 domain-containing protein n=1 Tax=Andreprevotia lacus DSM 23236 TaxID=1121001 RepID=A0A1W1XWP9_9NEIS|nr:DUF3617 family protein [Andreprevotia lacus]SMC28389.1 Protein of unknown function [Andreprevotia lacus DSM 23236]
MRRLILLSCTLLTAAAQAGSMPSLMPSEGKWAITTEMPPEQKAAMGKMDPKAQEMMKQRGMDMDLKAGTMTMTMCLNKQNINRWHEAGEAQHAKAKNDRQCDEPKYDVSGNTMTMDMKCSKPEEMTMHSVFQFNAAHDGYTFEHTMTSPKRQMHMKGSAKKVGSC